MHGYNETEVFLYIGILKCLSLEIETCNLILQDPSGNQVNMVTSFQIPPHVPELLLYPVPPNRLLQIEPPHVEQQQMEPQQFELQLMEPQQVEPQQMEPQPMEPQQVEPIREASSKFIENLSTKNYI